MNRELAVSYKDEKFGVLSNTCNHAGGPLGKGRLDGEYIVCPWHNWKFHRCSGKGEPGFEDDCVPAYQVKVENGPPKADIASLIDHLVGGAVSVIIPSEMRRAAMRFLQSDF
jgi:nitrite reductase/ring-hydroxylating ferredoxin subunit